MIELDIFWVSLLLGLVEGLTEFLPISSTGHLIVTSTLVGFEGKRAETFGIFIQLGAILAVVWEYRVRLTRLVGDMWYAPRARGFVVAVAVAFLPSATIGFLLHGFISKYLFSPYTVAAALIVGGILILVVEALPLRTRTEDVEQVTWRQGLIIGLSQCVALWPGFSRSAATILGGVCVGLNRPSATEFSFFLAIPTMFGATFYSLMKNYQYLAPGDGPLLALSLAISFLVGWASVRWLLHYVSNHTFRIFAWYRMAFGVAILFVLSRV